MTHEKVKQVTAKYRERFQNMGVKPASYAHDRPIRNDERVRSLDHCMGMLNQIDDFVNEGRLEKAFRWLGFVQGVLWSNGMFSLDDLKNDNRP